MLSTNDRSARQGALSAGQSVTHPRIDRRRCIEGARKGFEDGFSDVVRLFTIFQVDVEIAGGLVGEGLKTLFD